LVNEPLLKLSSTTDLLPSEYILEQVERLDEEERKTFMSFSYRTTLPGSSGQEMLVIPESVIPLAIVRANSFDIGSGMVAVFHDATRMNHACAGAFNVVYSWREAEDRLYVHAVRDIKQGEEILTTYINTKKPRSERQSFLSTHYHFDCKCSVCSLPEMASASSDARLSQMRDLYEKLATWNQDEIDGEEANKIANSIWNIGGEEGYTYERGALAADAAIIAAAHSDAEAAKAWYLLAAQWSTYELGADSDKVIEILRAAAATDPTEFRRWGTKRPMKVGGPAPELLRASMFGNIGTEHESVPKEP